ncbi:hypothetical protein [Priestia megaterium]|uniref:Uncharacterized protein n=1 Tax=Priestia megaterium TaxID=1404 RepID=A0A6M6E5G0_PRIMG|nr:hypothetical protein [Priestia megaterium]QJX80786.1 hypothetical protein FDZ14_32365 [Priestia megaterium]
MKSLNNLSFKENSKDIIAYIILTFLLVLCISLLVPSVREHIRIWIDVHTTNVETHIPGALNKPSSVRGSW